MFVSDFEAIYNAITEAKKVTDKPSIIKLRTIIGYGSKMQGTHGVHGARMFAICMICFKLAAYLSAVS